MRAVLLLLVVASSALAQPDAMSKEVRTVLDAQVIAWNKGDLVEFMAGYWEADALTFFSGNTKTAGWKATLERYRKRYQQGGKEMGTLAFEEIAIEPLGPNHALVRGRFRLRLTNETPTGLFTLIVRRTPAGWRIVHDHTSS